MSQLNIVKAVPIERSPRVIQLEGLFDVPPAKRSEQSWNITFPYDEQDWQIGLIIGPSGSGKTTVAREEFGDNLINGYDWPEQQSIVDAFPDNMGIKDITGALSSVGFSSPPSWLRPFRCLSNGEQFRATLARAIASSDTIVMDEFTSVVDRTVAQIGSAAVAKTIRRQPGKKFIGVTCHYDVAEWLDPDWILEMPDGEFTRRSLRRRPPIELVIRKAPRSLWKLFGHHHYLSRTISRVGSACFAAFYNDRPVAFVATMSFPHPIRPMWREHRCVCLPDFQGVGIGNALSEYVASLYVATGKPYRSLTSNPAMIYHRAKSPLWSMKRTPSRTASPNSGKSLGVTMVGRNTAGDWNKVAASNRLVASFEYCGPARPKEARDFGLRVSDDRIRNVK